MTSKSWLDESFGNTGISPRDAGLQFIASAIFLVLSLLPFLQFQFATQDDWTLLNSDYRPLQWTDELSVARPVFGFIIAKIVFPIVHVLPNLLYGRLLAIAMFAVALSAFALFVRRYGFSATEAFCVSALVFSLPGVQQRVAFVISLPTVFATLLSVLAGIWAVAANLGATNWHRYGRREIAPLVGIALLIAVSFLTYQNCPMFFLLPVFCDAVFSRSGELRRRMADTLVRTIFLFAVIAPCFFIYKLVVLPFIARWLPGVLIPSSPQYHLGLSARVADRVLFFFKTWLPCEARLWFLELPIAAIFCGAIVAFGVFWLLRYPARARSFQRTKHFKSSLLWALACGGSLILVSNLPSIMSDAGGSPEGIPAREMFPASAIIVLLVVWIGNEALWARPKVSRVLLIAFTIAAGVAANARAFYTATNAAIEFTVMRDAVGRMVAVDSPLRELLIIRPPFGRSYVGAKPYLDEFNFVSSIYEANVYSMYQQAILTKPTTPRFVALAHESTILFDPAYRTTYGDEKVSCRKRVFYLGADGIIADMAAPMHLTENAGSCIGSIARYSVLPASNGRHPPTRALAGGVFHADDFWEAGPYPVILTINYPNTQTITSYSLGTEFNSEKMPWSWRFEGDADGGNWVTLDKESNISNWPLHGQGLSFPISKPGAYRSYRLVFTTGPGDLLRIYHISFRGLDTGSSRAPPSPQ